ncbi:hypothetical protein AB1N83_014461 [Pleurotus pulmonarius]
MAPCVCVTTSGIKLVKFKFKRVVKRVLKRVVKRVKLSAPTSRRHRRYFYCGLSTIASIASIASITFHRLLQALCATHPTSSNPSHPIDNTRRNSNLNSSPAPRRVERSGCVCVQISNDSNVFQRQTSSSRVLQDLGPAMPAYVRTCRLPSIIYACMVYACMRVCVYACMRVCVYAYMRVCVYARMHAY